MIALIQSAIRNDIFAFLNHDGSSKFIWEALRVKAEGGKQIKKNKIALLKKEFGLFDNIKGESVTQMIERFCHLKIELERFEIVKTREEIIDKVIEALPRADQWQTFVFILKNDALYETISLDTLFEKIETHELELKKQNKMSSSSHQQNVGLYYKGDLPSVKADSSPKTAFSGERTKEPQTSSSSYHPGYHSSASKANSEEAEEILCNIALKLKNSPAMSINAAKQQMSFLASVLESYEGLVAGKIGNSELTKEDYDQIDPEEMELIDIRWCLASCIRRAQRYIEITRKQSLGGASTKLGFDKSKVTCFKCKQKGHFKRECINSAVGGNEHPFNDDYYRKAIYHRSREEPKMTEDKPSEKSRACAVIHDDEGFD
ncbi:putative transcription factor interactor and regulator CCHC(Zn) family [Helianthus annuus]|nr:putative transcription factor interactor and regulator CCHC(Zn) family [Helianthus annuus]